MSKLFVSLFLIVSLTSQLSKAEFVNSGTFSMRTSNINADVFVNTGTLEGIDNVNLKCGKLLGNGLIKGPKIEITAVECAYTGVIECSQECILITNTPASALKFQFKGPGKLIVRQLPN